MKSWFRALLLAVASLVPAVCGAQIEAIGGINVPYPVWAYDGFVRGSYPSAFATPWVVLPTDNANFQVASSKEANVSSLGSDSDYYNVTLSTWSAAQFSWVILGSPTTSSDVHGYGPIVRASNSTFSWYGITCSQAGFQFVKVVSGTGTNLVGPSNSHTCANGDLLALVAIGTQLTAFDNWVQFAQVTDTSISAGYPGIRYSSTDSAGAFVSAWGGGQLGTPPSPLSFTTASPLSTATVGTPYSVTLAFTGGAPTYSCSFSTAPTPNTGSWLSINSSTCVISGTPTTAETETIPVTVTDTAGGSGSKTYSLTVNSSGGGGGSFNPGYPRVASGFIAPISWSSSINTAWTNWLAALPVNFTSVIAGQGANMYGASFKNAVAQVKSLSSVGSKVYQYYFTQSPISGATYFANGLSGVYNEVNSFNTGAWWAWPNANSRTPLPSGGGAGGAAAVGGVPQTNSTIGVLPGGSSGLLNGGLNFEQWVTQYNYQYFSAGGNGSAASDQASNLDGFYHDNWGAIPSVSFDYDFNGSAPSAGTSDANFLESYGLGLKSGGVWLTANTTLGFLANIGAWYPSGASLTYLSGVASGGLIEGMIGVTYAPDMYQGTGTSSSPTGAWNQYTQAMANTTTPNLVIVGHLNINSNGSDSIQTNAYAAMRYGLTLTLQQNGYYFASEGTGYAWVVLPFDEYWVNPTTAVACPYTTAASVASCQGYMGQPTSAWGGISGSGNSFVSGGFNVRLYYNATTGKTWVALNCPHGANWNTSSGGSCTISATTLHSGSAGFKLISGTQDSTTNSGATVSSITRNTYDGQIAELL